jgi:hypothetical protein
MVYKARTVGEGWAEERAADLRSKSYDAGHIDDIAERAREAAPPAGGTAPPRK